MREVNDGWDMWYKVAHLLVKIDKEATLWDLAKAMYRGYNNRDMPIEEPENDYDLIYYHLQGRDVNGISWAVDISPEAIKDYLESMGFDPWREELEIDCYDLMQDYNSGTSVTGLSSIYGVSRYIVKKIIREFEHAKVT